MLLHHAHTFNWDRLLQTFPDARALTYPTLTFKEVARVAAQLNHMCAGQLGGGSGCFLTFFCLWGYRAGVRLSAPAMSSPPDDWRVSFQGRDFLPPYLRMESIRRTGFLWLNAMGMEFDKLPATAHCAFLARAFEVRGCDEIAISSYLLGRETSLTSILRIRAHALGVEVVRNRGRRLQPITSAAPRETRAGQTQLEDPRASKLAFRTGKPFLVRFEEGCSTW